MKKFFKQKKAGFTLVETLVAVSIFTVSILGLLSVLTQGISNTGYAKRKVIAEYLAQEGIEYIRNMRDTHVLYSGNTWNSFKTKLSSCVVEHECGFNNAVGVTSTDPGYEFIFSCSRPGGCALYLNNGDYNSNFGTNSGFTRKIWMTISGGSADEVKIYSDVSWVQGSGTYHITFSENLYNWVE